MCGLAGQFMYQRGAVELPGLRVAQNMMTRRGPDGRGEWVSEDRSVALVHRRLSIIDLSEHGAQPMSSADGRLRVVFNGEIYNYLELRRWCEQKGALFRSESDTEVLLNLYEQQGPKFLSRLRGMFAFALWDEAEQALLLARDPLGIKPLYYSDSGSDLVFASQVKALLHSDLVTDRAHSAAGVVSFFLWGYVTDPHTIYRHIAALPAGHSLIIRRGGRPEVRCYSDPLDALRAPRESIPSGELHEILMDSIRHHLVSDVPVGLFLSAGIDSGALCALTREIYPRQQFGAVTLGFQEYLGSENDETQLAAACARRYDFSHAVHLIKREDFVKEKTRLFEAMDQPTVDGVNTYLVSKAAAQTGFKVAMSGVGGDELFGGYPSFKDVPQAAAFGRWIPAPVGRLVRQAIGPLLSPSMSPKAAGLLEYSRSVEEAYLLRRALFMPWELDAILGKNLAREGLEELDPVASMREVTQDINDPYYRVMALEYGVYLRNCLLRDADWAGMAHSLEIRTPLVDAWLFKSIAGRTLQNTGQRLGKLDLALAPARPLPGAFLRRPKTGFSVPVREWLLAGESSQPINQRGRGLRSWALHLATQFGLRY